MIDRRKQYKYVINMPSIEDKFQIKSAIFEPVIFKTAHKNVTQSCTQWKPHSHTFNLFIEFIVKNKKGFIGGYVKQITKNILRDLRVFSLSLLKLSIQISIASSRGMLVNKESTSGLAMYKLRSCLRLSSAKSNKLVTVYSFSVKGVKNRSKNFATLQATYEIGWKGGSPFLIFLCTFPSPYKIPGLNPTRVMFCTQSYQ